MLDETIRPWQKITDPTIEGQEKIRCDAMSLAARNPQARSSANGKWAWWDERLGPDIVRAVFRNFIALLPLFAHLSFSHPYYSLTPLAYPHCTLSFTTVYTTLPTPLNTIPATMVHTNGTSAKGETFL